MSEKNAMAGCTTWNHYAATHHAISGVSLNRRYHNQNPSLKSLQLTSSGYLVANPDSAVPEHLSERLKAIAHRRIDAQEVHTRPFAT